LPALPFSRDPYRLQVVLRVAPHRLLTPVFKEQLQRELRDSLQGAFGKLAAVEVVTEHPLLKDIDTRGLQSVLDGSEKDKAAGTTPVKTHFVLVDFVDGQYEIQAGQQDGLTGLATPVVRQARTADRQFVSRTVAQFLDRDFGVVGTVTRKIDDQHVEVTLKGSQLAGGIDRFLGEGDVLAIAQIGRGGTTTRVDESFLQVEKKPKDGVCTCRLFNRYKDAKLTEGGGVLGYRCLKLGTSDQPVSLRLRLVDLKGQPVDGLQVEVSRHGFDRKDDFKHQGPTRSGGLLETTDKYSHAAFVRVLHNRQPIAQVPVPVIDGRTVTCRVNVKDETGNVGLLQMRRRAFFERLTDTLLAQDDLRKDLSEFIKKDRQDAALERAREGHKGLEDDVRDFEKELLNLRDEAKTTGVTLNLALGEQRLAELRSARDEMKKHVDELADALHKLKTDAKNKELFKDVSLARLMRSKAEYDQAIQIYEDALKKHGANEQVQKELDQLKSEWKVEGPAHQRARDFIYDDWPKQDRTHRLKSRMRDANDAFEEIKKAKDKLAAHKLALINVAHADRLNKELKGLKPDEREDDKAAAKLIEDVAGDLQKLHQDVLDFIGIKKPAKQRAAPRRSTTESQATSPA